VSLPSLSVRRPVFTSMVTLMVVVLGGFALTRLRTDMLPNIELPTVSIRTDYEGASPEVMERLVTRIVEEIVATVPGVEEITSVSSEGRSSVRVTFSWGTDVDTAALDVQATLEDEINELPDDIVRPRVSKFDVASYPVVLLGISSSLDPVELTELVENEVRYRFARVPGVAQVDVWGGFNREVRVELDPDRIKAFGLPLDRVLRAIRDANLDLPAGKIEKGRYEVTLRAPAEYRSLDQIRDTVIVKREDATIRLGQVATVLDTYERLRRIVRVNGERGIRVAIRKQADANTVEVSREVLRVIDKTNAAFPQLKIVPVVNQGNFIERSIANVGNSVVYGGGLAVLVLLFFLRSVRSTVVIALAIPISVVATFALVYLAGFSLNLMTLGGLALGVGMMVDSSIVVLENIYRRRDEEGEDARPRPSAGRSRWLRHPGLDDHHAGHLPSADLRPGRQRPSLPRAGVRDHVLAGLLAARLPEPAPHARLALLGSPARTVRASPRGSAPWRPVLRRHRRHLPRLPARRAPLPGRHRPPRQPPRSSSGPGSSSRTSAASSCLPATRARSA
jgi:HAE1 family hydrophobic/amphiphilic exporter-1